MTIVRDAACALSAAAAAPVRLYFYPFLVEALSCVPLWPRRHGDVAIDDAKDLLIDVEMNRDTHGSLPCLKFIHEKTELRTSPLFKVRPRISQTVM